MSLVKKKKVPQSVAGYTHSLPSGTSRSILVTRTHAWEPRKLQQRKRGDKRESAFAPPDGKREKKEEKPSPTTSLCRDGAGEKTYHLKLLDLGPHRPRASSSLSQSLSVSARCFFVPHEKRMEEGQSPHGQQIFFFLSFRFFFFRWNEKMSGKEKNEEVESQSDEPFFCSR